MAKVTVNRRSLDAFVQNLASKYQKACQDTVPFIQELTPVDAKRLYNSTRAENTVTSGNSIDCNIIAGGVSLYGELREQDIKKDVDYAYYVEIRDSYIRSNLVAIGQELVENLKV